MNVQLPATITHDPDRTFKRGDIVRMKKKLNGRDIPPAYGLTPGGIYLVASDEIPPHEYNRFGKVILEPHHHHAEASFHELELLYPAELLTPFVVRSQYNYTGVYSQLERMVDLRDRHVILLRTNEGSPLTKEMAEEHANRLAKELNDLYRWQAYFKVLELHGQAPEPEADALA